MPASPASPRTRTIRSSGLWALSKAASGGALRTLAGLGLSGNAIGNAGLRALAGAADGTLPEEEDASPYDDDVRVLPKLDALFLVDADAADDGLNALGEAIEPRNGGLPALRVLCIDEAWLEHPKLKTAAHSRGLRLGLFDA